MRFFERFQRDWLYNSTPGFYLLVGPDWQGEAPRGITKIFRSPTNTGLVGPRIAQTDTAEDKKAVQQPLAQGGEPAGG